MCACVRVRVRVCMHISVLKQMQLKRDYEKTEPRFDPNSVSATIVFNVLETVILCYRLIKLHLYQDICRPVTT